MKLDHPKASRQLETLIKDCSMPVSTGTRLLEIGSKSGAFLEVCAERGIQASGTEIVSEAVEALGERCPGLDVRVNGPASLPFESNTFDYVVSFQVLEHMSSLKAMLREAARVLRPGGVMYHVCPNYKSFYEGHYRVVWLPFLRKASGAAYLRLLGRDTRYFMNKVFPIRPARLRGIVEDLDHIELVSLGRAEFERKFSRDEIAKIKNGTVRSVASLLNQTGFLKSSIVRLVGAMGLFYPLTLVARKHEIWACRYLAIVPAGGHLLYSRFDNLLGHYRRYGRDDAKRLSRITSPGVDTLAICVACHLNAIGAAGWLLTMRNCGQREVKRSDVRNSERPSPLSRLLHKARLRVEQSPLFVW